MSKRRYSDEDVKDMEMQRAIDDLAKTTKEIKKKNWDRYKNIFPELYAEEFGKDLSIAPQIQKIVDKGREKYYNLKEENKRLKEDIKIAKKENDKIYKYIEKMKKNAEKRELKISELEEKIRTLKEKDK